MPSNTTGSPYITVVYDGATPIITSLSTSIISVDASPSSSRSPSPSPPVGGGNALGTHYLVKLGNAFSPSLLHYFKYQ